ncbi:MAG: mechanosensitive ion channel family protein [Treponema sp.]|jgi:small-conductance mechanosensitive channel|nr:mechanosensitive ion channel family protein [Treponema sp.]
MRFRSIPTLLLFGIFLSLSFNIAAQEKADQGQEEELPAEQAAPGNQEAAAGAAGAGGPARDEPVPASGADASGLEEKAKSISEGIEANVAIETEDMDFIQRLGIALAVIAGQVLLIFLVWLLFKFAARKVAETGAGKIKPLTIKKLKLLTAKQIVDSIQFLLRILKYLVTLFQLFLTVPIVFSLFPETEKLASTLFGYILTPLKNIIFGTIRYIPNLITIIIITLITRYVVRGLKFFSRQVSRGRLVLPGFYADWADPTFNILRVLLWAFTLAIVYPYLPGSDSRIFQGISVFVGIIFSLGSSSAIGNLVAGLVITYMRPFKIGDRIKINEVTGFVVEKTLMVVRIKTHKNEYVTFPNTMILGSGIVNYNTSSDEDEEGLILNTSITFGYNTAWQTVHEILISAALATGHVLKKPKPFVLQTAMDDFYANYQINCYTKEVNRVPAICSELHENIQNGFRTAGIDMTAAHFRINIPYTEPEKNSPREGKKKKDGETTSR